MSVFPAISTASVVITGLARAFRDHTPYGLLNGTKRLRSQRTLGPLFNSIPGRGGVMIARLLALMGDSQELYTDPREIQATVAWHPPSNDRASHLVVCSGMCVTRFIGIR